MLKNGCIFVNKNVQRFDIGDGIEKTGNFWKTPVLIGIIQCL